MRLSVTPKIVIRVSTVLALSASLVYANRFAAASYRVATAPGSDLGQTVEAQPLSPRLATLQAQLTSGNRNALDRFWKEITQTGTPIVEPVEGSSGDVLVTMLWRAGEETKNVFVFRLGDVSKPMTRLLDTNLWYKTFRLPKGARFIYQFAANLPDPKEWHGVSRFAGLVRNDPLNPHQYVERWNEFNPYEVTFFSAVELPGAEPQIWNVPRSKVPAGLVARQEFTSKLLGNERPIWIYTPHGYAVGQKSYGLLVLTDGGLYVNTARVATTLDNLIAAGLIPPLVAVMVENPHRFRELSCNSEYADFLAQEIVPWVRANYHATDRPEQTIIGGTSLGGLQAACTALKHSEVFGNVLSQSGDFKWMPDGEEEWEWVKRQFAARPRLPLRFSFEAGSLEGTWWWRDLMLQQPNRPPANLIDPTFLAANRNLRDMLQTKGYSVHYTEFNGNHGLFNWRGTLASHLIALVGIKPEPRISLSGNKAVAPSAVRSKAVAAAEIKVPGAVLKSYVGRYQLDPQFTHDFVIYVSVKNDSLWVKPSNLTARRLIAQSESRFSDSEIPDIRLTFIKDEKGNVTGLTLHSDLGDIAVKKMPPPVPSVGNTTFKLAGHADAEAVAIYGSFNNWVQTKNYCAKETDGWVCRVDLAPGKYTYKFLVDGVGLNDPANPATEDDGSGSIDSVIIIKPK